MVFSTINLYWSGYCYYNDIQKSYFPSKKLASWIKYENLTENSFLAESYLYILGQCIAANPYFDHIFYYGAFDDFSFMTHIYPSEEDIQYEIKKIKTKGNPVFIICSSPFLTVSFCNDLEINGKYNAIAFYEPASRFFKDKTESVDIYVMCTNETYKKLYGKDYSVPVFEK